MYRALGTLILWEEQMVKGRNNETIVREYIEFKEECRKQNIVNLNEIIKLFGELCSSE